MKAWRIGLAVVGVVAVLYGVVQLVAVTPASSLIVLAVWLAAALIIHDAVIAPSVVGTGWLLRRHVPDRGRRFLQFALIMIALITAVAVPMIFLRGSQPAVKALLLRNYGANLIVIIVIITVVTAAGYAIRVARDRSAAS